MVQDLLESLRTAVRDDDRSRAVELTAELLDAFERNRATVRARANLARTARDRARGNSDVVEAATTVLELAPKTNEAKIEVDEALLGYVSGTEPGDLPDALTAAIEVHDSFDERASQLTATIEGADVDLPVFVTVVAPNQFVVPKGRPVDGRVSIRNDTTQPAADVAVSLDSDAELALSETAIDRIPPGEAATVRLVGTPTDGEFRPQVTATVDDQSDSASPHLLVQNKRTYLEQAVDELVKLYNDLAVAAARADDSGAGAGGGRGGGTGGNGTAGGNDSLVPPGIDNTARTIARRTLQIIDQIEASGSSGNGRSDAGPAPEAIDNQIGSVVNEVEAFANQITAKAGKELFADAEPQLQRDAGALIDVYEDAQTAAV